MQRTNIMASRFRETAGLPKQYGVVMTWDTNDGFGLIQSDLGRIVWFDTLAMCDDLTPGDHVHYASNSTQEGYDLAVWAEKVKPL